MPKKLLATQFSNFKIVYIYWNIGIFKAYVACKPHDLQWKIQLNFYGQSSGQLLEIWVSF